MAWQSMMMILSLIFLGLELRSSKGLGECQSTLASLTTNVYIVLPHACLHACAYKR